MMTNPQVPESIRRAEKLPTEQEQRDLVNYLAAHPKASDLLEGKGSLSSAQVADSGRSPHRADSATMRVTAGCPFAPRACPLYA
jgi:hypothetical protein